MLNGSLLLLFGVSCTSFAETAENGVDAKSKGSPCYRKGKT